MNRAVNNCNRSIATLTSRVNNIRSRDVPRKANDLIYKVYKDFMDVPDTQTVIFNVSEGYKEVKINSLNNRIKLLKAKRARSLLKLFKFVKLNNDMKVKCSRNVIKKYQKQRKRRNICINAPINEKALLNLTDCVIPTNVKWLLSLGPKFSPPNGTFDPSDLYYAVCILTEELGSAYELNGFIEELYTSLSKTKVTPRLSNLHQYALNAYNDAKIFLKSNPDIMIINSDKGQITIVIREKDYLCKLENFIEKNVKAGIYLPINPEEFLKEYRDELKKINDLLSADISIEYNEKLTLMESINNKSSLFPNFYVTIKAHKEGHPVRPIVSAQHSHTVKLQECLLRPLQALVNVSFNAKNSFAVKKEADGLWFDDSYDFITLDVVDMFTNIPVQLIYDILSDKSRALGSFTSVPLRLFVVLLKFALRFSNVFKRGDCVYVQSRGLPMGGKLSTVVSCLIMDNMFRVIFVDLPLGDVLWFKKFVDDCVVLLKKDVIENFVMKCNAMNDGLEFTMKRSVDGSISYLDLSLEISDRRIVTRWYQKPISSGRFLNYLSNHRPSAVKNVALQFFVRILSLSDESHRVSIINKGIEILKLNCYPRWFIDRALEAAINKIGSSVG